MYDDIVKYIKSLYEDEFIPLHAPVFLGNEKKYVEECIDSTFVSSVGLFVNKVEEMLCDYTGANFTIATCNGTSALHIALLLAGVKRDDEVITQALTFVATANSIKYIGANPIFVDVDKENLALSPTYLEEFLEENAVVKDNECFNRTTGKRIKACVVMHTFGHPAKLKELKEICESYNIFLIEDAAESIGSTYKGVHTGTYADLGVLSFNGNKTVTAGGGGAILVRDEFLAKRGKHLTTTAKKNHQWEFDHDEIAFNYRMPNLNAALLCAQIEKLDLIISSKREVAYKYKSFFDKTEIQFIEEPADCKSNYWLNSILFKDKKERDDFLEYSNSKGVMTRPVWKLLSKVKMYKDCQTTSLENSNFFEDRLVNIPSSFRGIL